MHYAVQKKIICPPCKCLHYFTLFDTLVSCPSLVDLRNSFFNIWSINIIPHYTPLSEHNKKRFFRGLLPSSLEKSLSLQKYDVKFLITERNKHIYETIILALHKLAVLFPPLENKKRKRNVDD